MPDTVTNFPLIERRSLIVRTIGALTLVGLGDALRQPALADTTSTVVLTPQEEVGPYFVDEKLQRIDIRSDPTTGVVQAGLKLFLDISVCSVTDGVASPLKHAYVDIWEANAEGVYSDESSESTSGVKYLRGYQVTGAVGNVRFVTIYPGWYNGRTPHIHCRVRLYSGTATTYEFTTQFFFDDATTNTVYSTIAPYNTRGTRSTTNATDRVYNYTDCTTGAVGGSELDLTFSQSPRFAKASFKLLLDLTATEDTSCVGVTDGGINEGSSPGGPG